MKVMEQWLPACGGSSSETNKVLLRPLRYRTWRETPDLLPAGLELRVILAEDQIRQLYVPVEASWDFVKKMVC